MGPDQKLQLNQVVETPNGKAYVQGRVETGHDQPVRIIVAHTIKLSGAWVKEQLDFKGRWILRMYEANQIQEVAP